MTLGVADDRTNAALAGAGAVLLAGAAILAGCMPQQAFAQPGARPSDGNKASFSYVNEDGEGPKLVYGVIGSDEVDLMLECRLAPGQIEIIDARNHDAKVVDWITLMSDNAQSALPARLELDEEHGGNLVVAHADARLPALRAFRRSGVISIKLGAHQYLLTASAREKGDITRFFTACEQR